MTLNGLFSDRGVEELLGGLPANWAFLLYMFERNCHEPEIFLAENMFYISAGFNQFSSTGSAKQIL